MTKTKVQHLSYDPELRFKVLGQEGEWTMHDVLNKKKGQKNRDIGAVNEEGRFIKLPWDTEVEITKSKSRNKGEKMSHNGIEPYGQQILVRRVKSKDKSKGGIYLPDNAKQDSNLCEVLAVGPGKWKSDNNDKVEGYEPLPVSLGDTLLIGKWAGSEYNDPESDEEFLFIHIDSVLAKITK